MVSFSQEGTEEADGSESCGEGEDVGWGGSGGVRSLAEACQEATGGLPEGKVQSLNFY